MEHIYVLIDKILPLLSTLLGASITYYVTALSKKDEIKINAQIEARDKYWVPCALAISNLQNKITEQTQSTDCYISFQGDNSCQAEVAELLKYLQADKRIFFYKKTRNLLMLLEKNIQDYETAIENDVQNLIDKYRKCYYTMIQEFSVYKNNHCTDCAIYIKRELPQELKKALLSHKCIVWYGQIVNIDFIRDIDNPSNSFSTNMSYSDEDFFFDVWYQIKEGYKHREKFGLEPEQELGLDVLDYEAKHFSKYANELNNILRDTDYQQQYTEIFKTLNLLQIELFKNIDKTIIL